MPRPTNRSELLEGSAGGYTKLIELVESLNPEQAEAEFPFEDRDRNVRDVLAHLHEWTGTTSVGAHLVSSTSSHYDWACKKLRRYTHTLS